MSDLRMPDLNTVIIAGNLTNDPTFGETGDKTPVVNFHLASNRRFRDNKGQVKEDVCFVGVVAWDSLARSCKGKLVKGSSVVISGELQSRKWKSEDGHNRTIVEIKARKIQFLDKFTNEKKDEVETEKKKETSGDAKPNDGNGEQVVELSNMDEAIESGDGTNEFGYKGLEI
ncbi:MAG: single-stranded DNA-binding protein [Candidatus Marinimicrobia bacterium]|nr:single-stranded DNA-binding protein [Candidatus Neomarinimicrobiota bacterium]MCH7954537.1 single-stranded DNA-binding protein [Candidatus Neomarinimicrobiota bacterium]